MVEGLRLTIAGQEVRTLLQQRIDDLQERAARWSKAASGEDDDTDQSGQVPEHICEHETERLLWRVQVLEFLRDHVDPDQSYLVGPADLAFGELLPPKPESVEQVEYEERTAVGFHLGQLSKTVDRFGWSTDSGSGLPEPPMANDDPDFRVTPINTGGGPEVVLIDRK
jgi:hypothetical protein